MEKWRVLDMALGKRVSYPKRDARAATRAAIKAWVIDTAETRAANLAERARRAAEQAAAVEAAAATDAAAQEALAQAEAQAEAEAQPEAEAQAEAEAAAATVERPPNWDSFSTTQRRNWKRHHG